LLRSGLLAIALGSSCLAVATWPWLLGSSCLDVAAWMWLLGRGCCLTFVQKFLAEFQQNISENLMDNEVQK